MRVLWISSLAWNEGSYKFPVNGPGAVSGSLFQQQIITGLRLLGVGVDIIADYPYAERANRKGWNDRINKESDYIIIPSTKSYVKEKMVKGKWISQTVTSQLKKRKYDYAVAYLVHTPYMKALKVAKKYGMKTVLICPDLPDMMDMSLDEKRIKKFFKKIDMNHQNSLYKFVDGYVLFTKYMSERIPVDNKPSVVIEGVAAVDALDITDLQKELVVMHAGTLHRNVGIENIIEAMKYIDNPDLQLWIFGTGELKCYIEDAAKKDIRIKFKGFVDRKELFEYQKKAIALINARNPEDEYTKYSFPSKTYEYLYSGSYFITTKLLGIPEEYDKYLTYLADNSPKEIAHAINEILNGSLDNKNKDQVRKFLREKKTAAYQAKKLIELFSSL